MYLGNDLTVAYPNYRNIDDISASFNGSTTSFALLVNGTAPVPQPLNSQQCLISVGGVLQRPDDTGGEGFRLSGGNIVFSSAPATGEDFFGVVLAGADYVNAGGNFPDGQVNAPSITFDQDTDTGFYRSGSGAVSFASNGVAAVSLSSASFIAPSFIPTSSTVPTNGVYLPAANSVAISTNGSGRLFVDASGNISLSGAGTGIRYLGLLSETSSYAGSYTLQAGGGSAGFGGGIVMYGHSHASYPGSVWIGRSSGATGPIMFGTGGIGPGSEQMRITSAGLVGIGTSSPSGKVEVVSSGSETSLILRNTSSTPSTYSELKFAPFTGTTAAAASIRSEYYGNNFSSLAFRTTNINAEPTTKMFIAGDGNVGIGITTIEEILRINGSSNNQSRLRIFNNGTDIGALGSHLGMVGSGLANDLMLSSASTNNLTFGIGFTEKARIDSSGRLLVGTSTSIGNNDIILAATGNGNNLGAAAFRASASGAEINLYKSRSATIGTNTVVQSGDTIAQFDFKGADGTNYITAASIIAQVDATPGANDMPGRLVFSTTADGASSPTERMRIRSDGNIGVFNTPGLYPNTDNAASLGFSGFRWAAVYAANGTIQTSDQRAKAEITGASLGADFIKALRPVSYKWIEGGKVDSGKRDEDGNFIYESVPGTRTHWGFIAQEVKQAVDDAGVDFGGWVLTDKDDPDSQQALRYDQFIAPLTKALQEALAEIDILKAKVAALETA